MLAGHPRRGHDRTADIQGTPRRRIPTIAQQDRCPESHRVASRHEEPRHEAGHDADNKHVDQETNHDAPLSFGVVSPVCARKLSLANPTRAFADTADVGTSGGERHRPGVPETLMTALIEATDREPGRKSDERRGGWLRNSKSAWSASRPSACCSCARASPAGASTTTTLGTTGKRRSRIRTTSRPATSTRRHSRTGRASSCRWRAYVALTVFLVQKGSAESKKPRAKPSTRTPESHRNDPRRAVAGAARWHLAHALPELAVPRVRDPVSAVAARSRARRDRRIQRPASRARKPSRVSVVGFVQTSDFWFQSFQNWQSEFLAVGSIVVLTIFLRQKGSPESKPVYAPHRETGSD